MPQFFQWILFICLWSVLHSATLSETKVHPVAIFVVWIIGFVWGTGFIIAGKDDADHLTKRWLQMLAGMFVFVGVLFLILN